MFFFFFFADHFTIVNVNFSTADHTRNGNLSLSVNSSILPSRIHLNLEPNRNIVDSHFVAVIRGNEHSRLITDTMPDLNCYFKSVTHFDFAAVDICNGLVIVESSSFVQTFGYIDSSFET